MSDPAQRLVIGLAALAAVAWLLWPKRGLLSLWRNMHIHTRRTQIEHALKVLFHAEYLQSTVTLRSLAARLEMTLAAARRLVDQMQRGGWVECEADAVRLTDEGNAYAIRIVRAHRLWERFLADETGLSGEEWHQQAERLEHRTSAEEVEALARRLGNPLYDPHGSPIPTAEGRIGRPQGQPLTCFEPGQTVVVSHVDAAGSAASSQIEAEGIVPGVQLRILEMSPYRVRLGSTDDEHVLAPVVAARIVAVLRPRLSERDEAMSNDTLLDLPEGACGKVLRLAPSCRGIQRRRLMDLGILPGTAIQVDLTGPFGEPRAYRVRETLIALRRELAAMIYVEPLQEAN